VAASIGKRFPITWKNGPKCRIPPGISKEIAPQRGSLASLQLDDAPVSTPLQDIEVPEVVPGSSVWRKKLTCDPLLLADVLSGSLARIGLVAQVENMLVLLI
jgi:hypothetical protein